MVDATSYPNVGTLHRERMAFERDFTQLPNTWLRDKRLSFRARGLLAHLMTHDVGFSVSLPTLAAASVSEGKDAVRVAVNELEHCGYLHRVKERKRGRFTGTLWVLQDPFAPVAQPHPQLSVFPVDNPAAVVGNADDGKSDNGGKPDAGNPTTIRTPVKNNSSTEVSNEPHDAPVDNRGAIVWGDDRCAGNWRDGKHELGQHGMCRHCHERPIVRSAS